MISMEEKLEEVRSAYSSFKTRKEAQEYVSNKFDVTRRTVRNWASSINLVELGKKEDYDVIIDNAKKKDLSGDIIFVTWGQESTPVHEKFFKSMLGYAEFWGAEIAVIAGRYKNPTGFYADLNNEIWWDKAIRPYLTLNRHNVSKNVSILSDVKVQPTASTPMTGFEGFESEVSVVIGHPRVQMKVVPALEGYRKKEIFTTGACTKMNYTDSKAGKKGEFHHTLGFVIIEIDGDETHMRHVTACDDGSFIDIIYSVSDGIVAEDFNSIDVFACGDKHVGEMDERMDEHGKELITLLNPRYVRLDDLFNGHSVSHHEKNFPIQLYRRFKSGESLLRIELEQLENYLAWFHNKPFKVLIPKCNHDIFLDRYIDSGDWKKDIPNALEYMQCATILLEGRAPKGLIPYFIGEWYPDFITLGSDQSFRINEWEHSVHGHHGANGSRGSVIQYKRLSSKMVTNHTHSPSRYDGVVTGGTNTKLRVGYNEGASGWMHCDTITHKNGKAQQLVYHNYRCTTLLNKFK